MTDDTDGGGNAAAEATVTRPPGLARRADVLRPEWALDIDGGDVVAFETPEGDVLQSRVLGFSALDDHYGRPVVAMPDELADRFDEADVLILREEDVVEPVTDGGSDQVCHRCNVHAEDVDGDLLTLPVNDGDGVMRFKACRSCYDDVIGGLDDSGEVAA